MQVRIWRSFSEGQGRRSTKVRKSLSLQCKISIGNNSCSIEDRAVKFACSMEFSDIMADSIAWPPSLSCDRKWPRLTKYTHSRVVCLRLESTIVFNVMSHLISFWLDIFVLQQFYKFAGRINTRSRSSLTIAQLDNIAQIHSGKTFVLRSNFVKILVK